MELSSLDSIRGNSSTSEFIRLFGMLSRNPLNPSQYVLHELNNQVVLDLSATVGVVVLCEIDVRKRAVRRRHVCGGGGSDERQCVQRRGWAGGRLSCSRWSILLLRNGR